MSIEKKALVTGGSSGIGQGIAVVLAEHGYDVAITYSTRPEGAEKTCAEITKLGRKAYMYQQEMSEPDAAEKVVAAAVKDLGGISLMVNNAGRTIFHSVLTITAEQMQYLYGLNFRSYVLCAGAAARDMVRSGTRGSIIFITSSRGERAYAEDLLYGGFKAGINRACQSMALDLARYGIRVNCVAPGATVTKPERPITGTPFSDAIPLGRMGTPRDNGELVAFLASDKASYITGVTIRVDGGLVLPGMIEYTSHTELVHSQVNPDWTERVKKELAEYETREPE
ncbi:MAG: SDR family oxidoreductase [Clostridiales bacterium]|jgi:NAD(P)-dependent dehydrogenase (short-subunit alcohol dehydrogenase family)|nr:SDR family oxidoreductase [Clostridiales bacterium]